MLESNHYQINNLSGKGECTRLILKMFQFIRAIPKLLYWNSHSWCNIYTTKDILIYVFYRLNLLVSVKYLLKFTFYVRSNSKMHSTGVICAFGAAGSLNCDVKRPILKTIRYRSSQSDCWCLCHFHHSKSSG